jgi:hypothetical protein
MKASIQKQLLMTTWMPLLILVSVIAGCKVYSFTGASIPPEAQTISIQTFPNNASLVNPTLSVRFTNALRDRFAQQTNLNLVDRSGDLRIEGEITDYKVRPKAIQANEVAALNQLIITVKVKYTNTIEASKDYETTFSRFQDYQSNQSLSSVEDQLVDEITEMLVDDIFNKAVVNW